MASNGINISLKSYDSIFQNDEQRNSEEIKPVPISEMKPFEQQPFKVLLDESMDELVDSIKQSGVLTPVIARPHKDGGYEILSGHRRVKACELDSITGRIAQQLYQKNSVAIQGFEDLALPDSFFDIAIGNVPFGDFKVLDKKYNKYNFLIHDFFFAKTLDKVRPGGVVAFITSSGTMDKRNSKVRRYIAQRADLIGAIRLPNNTFKKNAGTEVTADILFLQKRERMTDIMPAWVNVGQHETGQPVNQYFLDNPDMVMGELKEVSGPFGPELTCVPDENTTLAEQLEGAIQNIHAQITEYEFDDVSNDEEITIPADPNVRNFSYTVVDGDIYFRENSLMRKIEMNATAENRVKGMIELRDCVRTLIEYQTENYSDDLTEEVMTSLQLRGCEDVYDECIECPLQDLCNMAEIEEMDEEINPDDEIDYDDVD